MSANLSGATLDLPSTASFALVGGTTRGTVTAPANPSGASAAKVGVLAPVHDLVWFEKVHVLPRAAELGILISEQAFAVEVWNSDRSASKVLTAINVTGAAGLVVDNPFGALPLAFPPLESKEFTVRALTTGDANIDNVATWVFTGVASSGTTLSVTGSRLILWPFPWNPSDDLVERYGALTDIFEARSGKEQRRQLRGNAQTTGLEYSFLLRDGRDAGHANALLYGGQAQPYGVPHWQYSTRLATQLDAGSDTVIVDTADVPYEVGEQVVLWRDPYTWEALTIEAVGAGSITCTTGARATWPAGFSIAMPLSVGRLSREEGLSWLDLAIGAGRFAFSLEAVARTPAAASPTQYLGFDVLDQKRHDRQGALEEQSRRKFELFDPGTGKRQADVQAAQPAPTRPLIWTCRTRAAVAALRAFLEARKGRAVPFWLPSYQQDLVLAADAANGAASLTVKRIGYVQQMFPAGGGRRHVAIQPHGGGLLTLRSVLSATDPGDGLTESLGLSTGVPQAYPAASTIVSFLKLCRLETDEVELRWLCNGTARAVIQVREVPNEAPV